MESSFYGPACDVCFGTLAFQPVSLMRRLLVRSREVGMGPFRCLLLSLCILCPGSTFAADDYPSKAIKLIVTYTPGGASDILARMIGDELNKAWKQPVVIDNRPGAGGVVGMDAASKSEPDGYTLVIGVSGTLVQGPHLVKHLPYDTRKDFKPIAMLAQVQNIMVVTPSFEAKDVQQLIGMAKARPGELLYASAATSFQLATELFKAKAKVNISAVPYKGDGPATVDVIAGRVPIMVSSVGAQLENVRAGSLRALAVLGPNRHPALPDVPTMIEAGVPGYIAVGWNSVVAPAGVSDEVADKLNREINRILELPEIKKKISEQGFQPWPMSRAEFARVIDDEYRKWGQVVEAAGIQPQ
jgi:tripartite-type tricarboxylate transporter receptor subunit TctC